MSKHTDLGYRADEDCGLADCYGCNLRRKGLNLSNAVTATRQKNMRPTPSKPPAINARIATQDRPGGYKMPILKANGDPLRHKEYREKEAKVLDTLNRIQTPKE